MTILFCNDVLQPSQPDADFAMQAEAARENGFDIALLDFGKLTRGETQAALRRARSLESDAIYRGWMLKPETYALLFDALRECGTTLVNTPTQHRHCHHLPESYAKIESRTPRTLWFLLQNGAPDFDDICLKLQTFGDNSLILKDYVKSRKHEWLEACFIENAGDRAQIERVTRRFIELQGEELNEGLVFRQFVPLRSVGVHAQSGAPLSQEFRLWFWKHELLYSSAYWDGANYSESAPPLDDFAALARTIESDFFTMDVAQTQSGDWLVVELGDAQVSGLPTENDIAPFYAKLAQTVS